MFNIASATRLARIRSRSFIMSPSIEGRFQHPQHKVGVYCLYGQPLCSMLAVTPSGTVRVDVGFSALLESDRFGLFEPRSRAVGAS